MSADGGELRAVAEGVYMPAVASALACGAVSDPASREYLECLAAAAAPVVAVEFSEEELLALAAALDGNGSPGNLGSAIAKVREAAMSVVYGSSSRANRGAGER